MGEQTCTLILGYQPDDRVSLRACQVLAALFGHAECVAQRPFSGAKRKTYARMELFPVLTQADIPVRAGGR